MTDLYRKELEDFRDYRATFLANTQGQRVLADLIEAFNYNRILLPGDQPNARDVIRYILDHLGFGEDSETFVKALAMANVKGPEPFEQKEAVTE